VNERGIKIAVSGKGGVGKTTLAALLCRALCDRGYRVLAVDADPAGGLGAALGFPDDKIPTPLSEMQELIAERTGVKPGNSGALFKLNPQVADLPETLCREHNGLRLLVMGTVQQGGGGCLCPEGALLRALVQHLFLYRHEAIVMDMEAGLEHLGRATAQAVDQLLIVVEPGQRSIDTAKKIQKLAADIGLASVSLIANKLRHDADRQFITTALEGCELRGLVPFDERLLTADMCRKPPWELSQSSLETARVIADIIINQIPSSPR